MANLFKKVIDRQMWVPVAQSPNVHVAGGCVASDMRNTTVRHPIMFQLASSTVLNRFNFITKAWNFLVSPALAGTFGAGAGCVFAPSLGLLGSIGAGCTSTSIVTTTAMASVGVNMLANRGGSGDFGFRVRIIGKSAGGSGKIEERWIIGNTSGTTPTLLLDTALTFTPANGDTYEILGGRLFMLGAGTTATGSWRSFETVTNALASLGITNLPTTISTDFTAVALDEQYVPYDAVPGEGMVTGASTYNGGTLKCLLATASASGSITGQSSAGDASVVANEFRNFQIRIVEDTAIPTAVNQRAIIASHTAGPSAVYTLGANWTVTPSSTAKFVIEYPNLILLRSSATTTVYTYNYGPSTINNGTNSIATNAWHITYFATGSGAHAAGAMMFQSSGVRPDTAKNARNSFVHFFRGGGGSTLDVLDISNTITGTWSANVVYDGAVVHTTGACGHYAPSDGEGRFAYINSYVASTVNQIYRYDVKNRVMTPYTPTDYLQSGTALVGGRIGAYTAIDGTDKYSCIFLLAHSFANAFEIITQV